MHFVDYVLWVLAGIGGLIMWGTQVGPKQAISHTAEWAQTFGVKEPPRWLKSEDADRTIRHIAFGTIAVCVALLLANYFDVSSMRLMQKFLFGVGCFAILGAIAWSLVSPDKAIDTAATLKSDIPFLIEFPGNEAFRMDDPYALSTNIGVAGDVMANFISSQTIRFKLTNTTKVTTRNVEVFVTRVAYTPKGVQIPLKIRLPRLSSSNVNLRPNEADYFQLVEFLNPQVAGGLAGTKHVSRDELDSVKWIIQPNLYSLTPIGVSIPTLDAAEYRLNRPVKNVTIHIDIEIYADDLPVTRARFTLTDPEKIKVQLVAQGFVLPELNFAE